MTARARVQAMCDERGWFYWRRRCDDGRRTITVGDDRGATFAMGATEEEACEALLVKLSRPALVRAPVCVCCSRTDGGPIDAGGWCERCVAEAGSPCGPHTPSLSEF